MTRIVLHVDRLLLRGVRSEDRAAIADALRGGLAQQFSRPDAAAQLSERGDVERVHAPIVRVPANATPALIGRAVARGIGRGVTS
jgi:hypothetical protein